MTYVPKKNDQIAVRCGKLAFRFDDVIEALNETMPGVNLTRSSVTRALVAYFVADDEVGRLRMLRDSISRHFDNALKAAESAASADKVMDDTLAPAQDDQPADKGKLRQTTQAK